MSRETAMKSTGAIRILHVPGSAGAHAEPLGPYQIQALIPENQELRATAYRVRIPAGQRTATSYHLVAEELYFVISGRAVAVLDGVDYPLQPGDFLRLPPGVRHQFVTGPEELVMLDIHTPGSRPDRDVFFEGETPPGFGSG